MVDLGCCRRSLTQPSQITPASILTYLLFCVFGVGSWVAVNGVFGELSVLVVSLPECYHLPAILTVVVQIANIGPVTYIVLKLLLQHFSVRAISIETVAVYALVIIGLASCILLSFFWERTAVVGDEHSVALIVLVFFLALVDCTSTLVFIPFMKHFPAKYISALYIGEGMSGVLPSVAALSQGFVNDDVECVGSYAGIRDLGIHFSPNAYFAFLASLTVACGLAFTAIVALPFVRKQKIPTSMSVGTRDKSPVYSSAHSNTDDSEFRTSEEEVTESREARGHYARIGSRDDTADQNLSDKDSTPFILDGRDTHMRCRRSFTLTSHSAANSYLVRLLHIARNNLLLLVCMFVLNFITNGTLPALSAFIFKPYGNTVYTVALNLGILVGPLATLFYVLVSHKSRTVIAVLTAIIALLGTYLLVISLLSPDPLLKDHMIGKVIIVSAIIPRVYVLWCFW